LASAATFKTDADVRAALASQGYSQISDVKRDGDTWTATVKAAGNNVNVRVDSTTGEVVPASQLSPMDILQSLQAAGYTDISTVSFYGGVWKAYATSSTGKSVLVKVDPADGHVIDEKEQ